VEVTQDHLLVELAQLLAVKADKVSSLAVITGVQAAAVQLEHLVVALVNLVRVILEVLLLDLLMVQAVAEVVAEKVPLVLKEPLQVQVMVVQELTGNHLVQLMLVVAVAVLMVAVAQDLVPMVVVMAVEVLLEAAVQQIVEVVAVVAVKDRAVVVVDQVLLF
jgi:hypothetical protein